MQNLPRNCSDVDILEFFKGALSVFFRSAAVCSLFKSVVLDTDNNLAYLDVVSFSALVCCLALDGVE